jgi:hypothetical protein
MAFSPLTQLIALFSGTGKLINRGGAKGATSAADVTSSAIDADHQALDVKVCATVAPSGVALDSTLTGGTCKAIARGGAKGATSAADCTSRSIDADHQALDVYDASCASLDGKFPAAAAVASDAEAASNTSRIVTRGQAWDDSQSGGTGGWSRIRAGLAKLTAATGKRSDAVGLLHILPFARYIQAADRPALTTQDIIQLIVNARGDLSTQEQYQPTYENNAEGYAEVALNPRGSTTSGLTFTDSAALENSHICMAGAGRLYAVDGRHETFLLSGTVVMSVNTTNNFAVPFAPVFGPISITLSGGWTGTAIFEAWDGQSWVPVNLTPVGGGAATSTATANGVWTSGVPGVQFHPGAQFRVRCNVVGTGTLTAAIGGPIQLYWQALNSTTIPANGTVPKISIPLAPMQPIPLLCQDDIFGRGFTTGMVWALSTTGATLTLATGTGGWFNVGTRLA